MLMNLTAHLLFDLETRVQGVNGDEQLSVWTSKSPSLFESRTVMKGKFPGPSLRCQRSQCMEVPVG